MQLSRETRQMPRQRTVLPILVLYKCTLTDSAAYNTLLASSASLNLSLISVYDNSPLRQVSAEEESHLLAYKHDPANGGVAAAYNWALDIAQSNGYAWLMLLDQDTTLPLDFLQSSLEQVEKYLPKPIIVALVPVVRSGGAVVSPKRVSFARLRPLVDSSTGIQSEEIMAINSGTIIRCDFVRSIGGFNRAYWLDYLDHWLFRQVYAAGRKVVVSSCILDHNLTVQDYRNNVTSERYRSILAGEASFITTHKPRFEIFVYLLHLLVRWVKMKVLRRPDIASLTIAMIIRIAMHPTRSLEGNTE